MRLRLILSHCMALEVLALSITFAQHGVYRKDFPAIPPGPVVSPTADQIEAWNDFVALRGSNWQVRWSERTGVPASLIGFPTEISQGNPEEVARYFLQKHQIMFKMKEALADLQVTKFEERFGLIHVIFQQSFQGIPIEDGIYGIHMTKDKKVYFAAGDYYDNVGLPTVTPAISLAQAIEVAQSDLGTNLVLRHVSTGVLTILPYGPEFRLCWKVVVPARAPLGEWVYFISAFDGSILHGYDSADFASAQGWVYDRHPNAGPVVERTLTNLLNPRYLNGTYVQVFNEDGSEAYEPDSTFFYAPSDTHFDEVMAYYHANRFQDEYLGDLGYPYLNYPNSLVKVQATVHVDAQGQNGQAIPPNELEFGDDGPDPTKEAVFIYHEYQHLVTEYITYDGLEGGDEETAMDEAFSDYFACSFTNTSLYGEYGAPSGQKRNLENNYTMSDGGVLYQNQGLWGVSQIFSGALWDLRQQLGQSTADALILAGLDHMDQGSTTFLDGREEIIAADNAPPYNGAHLTLIENIFAAREIGTGNYFSGTISQNTTWSGQLYVPGDVTVASGVTLTVQLGAVITFAANSDDQAGGLVPAKCELIVNGTLNASGATFKGPTKGSWYSIRYTSSSSAGSMTNCTIKNAYNAVMIDNKSPYIGSCFIDDAKNYGFYISGGSAWPTITQNYIEAGYAGVMHDANGNGNFTNNSFRNAKFGVYVLSGSPRYDYLNVGRNKFETSISQDKVKASAGQPWMGKYQYFTVPNGSYKYISNSSASTINATQNYWSVNPPSSTYFSGSVDRSNPLASPPSNPPAGPGWPLPKGMGDEFFLAFDEASMLFWDGKYAEARERFKELTEKYLDSEYSS